jgi:hypothetical protein
MTSVQPVPLRTDRLLLRPWEPDDREPFAGLNADPEGDFDHPKLPPGHRLRRHVLYRADLTRLPDPPDPR